MSKAKQKPLSNLHFHEALDRTSVLLHHGQMVGEHPVVQQDPAAKRMWDKIEKTMAELYGHLGQLTLQFDSRIAYMDGTDFAHELGEGNAPCGAIAYPSVKDLVREAGHDLEDCGIVKVEVTRLQNVPVPKKARKAK